MNGIRGLEYSIGAKLLLSFRIASGQQKALTNLHRRNLNGRRGRSTENAVVPVEHTGKAKHITPFVGAQIDIANAFGFKILDGCAPKYTSRKKDAPHRGRPSKAKTTELEH